ncbi:MAG: lantibiotic dehydratase C-terminal domain-containing protein [Bacteroidota bacterium]
MSSKESAQWLSAHLYYNEPWESFLTDAVLPYLNTTLQTGIAQKYFFIRYWERGPHLRLRLLGRPDTLREVLYPNLCEHFGSYFERLPSERTEPEYPPQLPDDFKWHPNNSIQFIAYQPEWERYGGAVGVAIAEETFFHSSRIVLANIAPRAKNWEYDDALGLAIKLHLCAVHGWGMQRAEARSFFQFFFYNWLPRAFRHPDTGDHRERETRERDTLAAFAAAFDQQRAVLIDYHEQLWGALLAGSTFEEPLLNDWIEHQRELAQTLRYALQDQRFVRRPLHYQFYNTGDAVLSPLEKQCWMQYADYLHLTNNRLGVLNRDEGYLAYLMMRSMENS